MEHIEKPDQAACVTGKRALLWAIYAERPLTLLELSEALATHRYLDLGYEPAVIQRRDRLSPIQLVEATGYFLHIEENTQLIQIHNLIRDSNRKPEIRKDYFGDAVFEYGQFFFWTLHL